MMSNIQGWFEANNIWEGGGGEGTTFLSYEIKFIECFYDSKGALYPAATAGERWGANIY